MLMNNYELRIPQTVLAGPDSVNLLGVEIKKLGRSKALLVTDEIMQKLGIAAKIMEILETAGTGVEVYAGVGGEPTNINVEEGLKIYKDCGCDFLVAVGGGSPIDTAKAIGIMVTNPGEISDYMGIEKVKNPIPPVVCIATTAGTGSEVTRFTIIADLKSNVKMLIGSSYIIPTIAVSDSMLTLSVPSKGTAATGIDALCHAIEAYVSKKAQPLSDLVALAAIRLIAGNLRQAWANGSDLAARTNMMLAATLAGMAFSNSSVTLIHGMSRPIGACFHIPHGISNAVLLPVWAEYTYLGNPQKFAEVAQAMGENISGLSTIEAAYKTYESVSRLCKDIRIPSISGLGIAKEEFEKMIPKMAVDAIASGSPNNNPRNVSQEDIMELYKKAW